MASIQALWFHQIDDAQKIYNLLQKLVNRLKGSTTEQARAAKAASEAPQASVPAPTQAPAAPAQAPQMAPQAPPKVDLLQLIKSAQNPPQKSAATIEQMPPMLQKLMLKEPGAAMSADELEKDLIKSAKPHRNHLLQEFTNSTSAISLAAVSTKPLHGSEGDVESDIAEGEILEPLDASFVVGSGEQTPVLNKEQVGAGKTFFF